MDPLERKEIKSIVSKLRQVRMKVSSSSDMWETLADVEIELRSLSDDLTETINVDDEIKKLLTWIRIHDDIPIPAYCRAIGINISFFRNIVTKQLNVNGKLFKLPKKYVPALKEYCIQYGYK